MKKIDNQVREVLYEAEIAGWDHIPESNGRASLNGYAQKPSGKGKTALVVRALALNNPTLAIRPLYFDIRKKVDTTLNGRHRQMNTMKHLWSDVETALQEPSFLFHAINRGEGAISILFHQFFGHEDPEWSFQFPEEMQVLDRSILNNIGFLNALWIPPAPEMYKNAVVDYHDKALKILPEVSISFG